MPKLEHIIARMGEKPKKDPMEVFDALIDGVVARNNQEKDLLRKVLSSIDTLRQELAVQIANIPETDLTPVLEKETDLTPVLKAVDALKNAVFGIKLPEYPKPEKVDFTQVLQRIDALSMKVDAIDVEMPAVTVNSPRVERVEEAKPKEWVFEVKRNASGFIKEVIAKEV